jgi:hypothetical protein
MLRSATIRFAVDPPDNWQALLAALCISVSLLGCRSFYDRSAPVTAISPGAPTIISPGAPTVMTPGPPAVITPGSPAMAAPAAPFVVAPGSPTVTVPPTIGPGAVAVMPPTATAPPVFPGLPPGPVAPFARGRRPITTAVGQLTLAPQTMVAPVGSDVVLLATARDGLGQPLAGHRVEWMLSPDSVGQLITL